MAKGKQIVLLMAWAFLRLKSDQSTVFPGAESM